MNHLFDQIEPLTTVEMLVRYWHYLRSIDETSRDQLGPLTVIVETQGPIRGWPVGLKNQTLALSTESQLSPKCGVVFVDVTKVVVVGFAEIHRLLPFITSGAVSRSPLEQKPTRESAQRELLSVCEDLRQELPAKIFFDRDPVLFDIDDVLNLNEVLRCLVRSLRQLRTTRDVDRDLSDISGLHVVNVPAAKDVSIVVSDAGEMELAFSFSRALPSNMVDQVDSLLASLF